MAVPYTFGNATTSIPLSQLDTNFATAITIGNTAVYLGNTTTTFGNVTLNNVTINSGNSTVSSESISGNLTFTGTGNRILGDFSNATVSNRVAFQTSTTNGNTVLLAITDGTGTASALQLSNTNNRTNAAYAELVCNATESQIKSSAAGTGTYLPITFYTNGSERMRLDTSGNLGVGNTSPSWKVDVLGSSPGVRVRDSGSTNGAVFQQVSGGNTYLNLQDSAALIFNTANAERMRIDSSGNVGIGTGSITQLFANYTQLGIKGGSTVAGGTLQFLNSAGTITTNLVSDTNGTYLGAVGGGYIVFSVGGSGTGTERMRIDSSGNVGIGTNSPANNAGYQTLTLNGTSGGVAQIQVAGTNTFQIFSNATANYLNGQTALPMAFYTNASERMRIDSSGNLLVGSTSYVYPLAVTSTNNERTAYFRNGTTSGYTGNVVIAECAQGAGTGFNLIQLYSNTVAQFRVRGDGTIYAQNTTVQSISDVRVKENIKTATDGLSVITQLRPVRFDFKKGFGNNKKNQLGFVAQEMEKVFPDAVDESGEESQDGDKYKSVGPSALIPVLVKAIQEQQAQITSLKAELDALKGTK